MNEKDMYAPVKKLFESMGYLMRSEVLSIDAVAVLGDEIILFEFKKNFNATLLFQAIDRQKASRNVYIVIPHPKKRRDMPKIEHIVKALSLGLITVDVSENKARILIKPPDTKPLNNIRTRAIAAEVKGRSIDGNRAGSKGEKLLTSYREKALKIACVLYKHGEMSAKELRDKGCHKNCAAILRDNHYGWFYPVSKGVYFLTELGFSEIESPLFEELVLILLNE